VDIASRSGDPLPGLAGPVHGRLRRHGAAAHADARQSRAPLLLGVRCPGLGLVEYPDERGPPAFPPELAVRTQIVELRRHGWLFSDECAHRRRFHSRAGARTRAADGRRPDCLPRTGAHIVASRRPPRPHAPVGRCRAERFHLAPSLARSPPDPELGTDRGGVRTSETS
jgi:hypothetical protein